MKCFVQARDTRGRKTRSEYSSIRVPPQNFNSEEIANVTDDIRELLSLNDFFESVGRYINADFHTLPSMLVVRVQKIISQLR